MSYPLQLSLLLFNVLMYFTLSFLRLILSPIFSPYIHQRHFCLCLYVFHISPLPTLMTSHNFDLTKRSIRMRMKTSHKFAQGISICMYHIILLAGLILHANTSVYDVISVSVCAPIFHCVSRRN